MSREVDFAAKPIDPDFMNKPDEYPETGTHFDHKVFADGFLDVGADTAWGRPVDVLQMPDGSLLVSDDHAHAIYRITYARK